MVGIKHNSPRSMVHQTTGDQCGRSAIRPTRPESNLDPSTIASPQQRVRPHAGSATYQINHTCVITGCRSAVLQRGTSNSNISSTCNKGGTKRSMVHGHNKLDPSTIASPQQCVRPHAGSATYQINHTCVITGCRSPVLQHGTSNSNMWLRNGTGMYMHSHQRPASSK